MIKLFDEIIEKLEKADNIGAVTKLEIYYNIKDFDKIDNFTELQKEKIINFIHTYWINNDFDDYNLYNVCDMVINSKGYCNIDVLENIDALTYEDFEKIINEC